MPAFVTFGRVLFAVLFIYSGATKLFGIAATADFIAAKVAIPALLAPYTAQLETMTGMPTPQMLAIAVGVFEVSGLDDRAEFRRAVLRHHADLLRGRGDLLFPRFLESGAAG
jgi:hypothetical protein